ncbi:MAG TPA: hypothetical protein VFH80_00705 [Solirubrobacteraceae bacterium]|nr:hypothetical protein [Solirubrobacteraceae bacterium]
MSTLLLTDQNNPSCIIAERSRARTRLSTRLRSRVLDRALAAGVSPDASAALSLRAHRLIGATARTALARTIRRLIRDARRPLHPLTPHVPLCRRKIIRSAQTLERLAQRLISGDPVDARGVAQVRLLLIGDSGALYDYPGANDLEPALQEAIQALEPAV